MLSGFKQFILRGNVIDMAVGVVIGAAFATVISAFTKDLLTPLIAAFAGKPDFSAISFTVNGSVFAIGDFINAAIAFCARSGSRIFLRGHPGECLRACNKTPSNGRRRPARGCFRFADGT
jgi:large conductance mechanosensitive channel